VGPRTGLDVDRRKILTLPGLKLRPLENNYGDRPFSYPIDTGGLYKIRKGVLHSTVQIIPSGVSAVCNIYLRSGLKFMDFNKGGRKSEILQVFIGSLPYETFQNNGSTGLGADPRSQTI
jgi:hypothetical protein